VSRSTCLENITKAAVAAQGYQHGLGEYAFWESPDLPSGSPICLSLIVWIRDQKDAESSMLNSAP
jgi:hypothetical protein